ncbi:methyl-accepting chemotaxis protein [Desulfallas thermosapovorans]|uniref:Methyl-accepting chemotaxis sensory transducer with Cache sensor n=1 Tax=Desulfallas thermosapovorans DSM 6562 TaxID=1121431 RepID=A0A5S4ZWH8_9FIRM|nr:methyl-accepting chemotaxis protein [Desulfallas thermosapovorans]TYO97357.1 methyl-accepting chemotaxis sensory transducer with Cache sensor [Desulfallas thermosapovorans DSM 6562]
MRSLKLKIILIISLTTMMILSVVSVINYNRVSIILTEQITNAAAESADFNAKIVNQWLDGIVKDINNRAKDAAIQTLDPGICLPVLKRVQEANEEYEYLYIADATGKGIGTNDVPVDVSDRDYFPRVMSGETVITDPIISKATGNQVIAVVAPVYNDEDGLLVGLVGVTVELDYLQKIIQDMRLSGTGYGLIQAADNTTIAHPDSQLVGNKNILELADGKLKQLLENMNNGEKGFGYYIYQGTDKILAYAPVELTSWSVAQTANVDDIMAPLDGIRNMSIAVTAIAVIIMVLIATAIASIISKPIVSLSRAAESIATGDLTQKIEQSRSQDEIGVLIKAFNKMVDNLKEMIYNIQNSSDQLASHSEELAATSEEISATVEEVASTTNEVAATSAQGAENAEYAIRESEAVQLVAGQGNQAVEEIVVKIGAIASKTSDASEAVQRLGQQSSQIGEIINTITGIAEQTNLLALNAAIEAARAGEHGRGFAVVAEEVRKLAEQSAGAARKITGLIKDIQSGVNNAVAAMEQGVHEVDEGVALSQTAGASLEQIIKAVEKNTRVINEVAEAAKQANNDTQQLSAANEQIASSIQQVSSATQELANIAGVLKQTVDRFKV